MEFNELAFYYFILLLIAHTNLLFLPQNSELLSCFVFSTKSMVSKRFSGIAKKQWVHIQVFKLHRDQCAHVCMRHCLYCMVKIGTIHHWQVYCTVVNQIQKLNTNPAEYSYSLKTYHLTVDRNRMSCIGGPNVVVCEAVSPPCTFKRIVGHSFCWFCDDS